MTTAAAARLKLATDTTLGLPKLPHIPEAWSDPLTHKQQEENLLHVALWVVERDLANFEMNYWHKDQNLDLRLTTETCGTTHCIAGFAQVMCGPKGFTTNPAAAGFFLLGREAEFHFQDSNLDSLAFLKTVIDRNS